MSTPAIWVRANGNVVVCRASQEFPYVERDHGGEGRWHKELPDDVIPLVPLLDVRSPEALRFAADVIDSVNGAPELADLPQSAWKLRADADRLEREQAAKTTREQVAQIIAEAVDNAQFKLDAHELEQVTQSVLNDSRISLQLNEATGV